MYAFLRVGNPIYPRIYCICTAQRCCIATKLFIGFRNGFRTLTQRQTSLMACLYLCNYTHKRTKVLLFSLLEPRMRALLATELFLWDLSEWVNLSRGRRSLPLFLSRSFLHKISVCRFVLMVCRAFASAGGAPEVSFPQRGNKLRSQELNCFSCAESDV